MRRISLLFTLVALLVGLVPIPASAQSEIACPPVVVPSSGFTDVDPGSVHKQDIDCVAWRGISTGTSSTTFAPKENVSRWQMALFLMRIDFLEDVVDGSDQGFTDIGALSLDTQKAINQLKQLSITSGTSPTTFTPHGSLQRWEMALFLTRQLTAMGVALPPGFDQGFTDVAGLDAATQKAINQLGELGITSGTTATTFSPYGLVTREQMASFITRTIQASRVLNLLDFGTGSCEGEDPEVCTFDSVFLENTTFVLRAAWYASPLPAPADFFGPGTRIDVTIDGDPVAMTNKDVVVDDAAIRYFQATFLGGLSDTHTFVISLYEQDVLVREITDNYTLLPSGF